MEEELRVQMNLVRLPKQKRSQRSLDKILQAATDVLARDGLQNFTINSVAEQGNISVGSIYRRFESRDALLSVVRASVREELVTRVSLQVSNLGQSDLTTVVRAFVLAMVEAFASAETLHSAAIASPATSSEEQEYARSRISALFSAYASALQKVEGGRMAIDPFKLQISHEIILAVLIRRLRGENIYASNVTWAQMAEEVIAAVVCYLNIEVQ